MNNGKAFLGVLAGIAAGTVLGILFAPEKGSNTRKNIVKKGEDLASALNMRIDKRFDELMEAIACKEKGSKNQTANSLKQEMVD